MMTLSPCRNGRAQCLTQCSHAAFCFKPHFTLSAKRPSHKAFTIQHIHAYKAATGHNT